MCTLEIEREEEIEVLKDTFIANDFPIETVDSVFPKYIPTNGRMNCSRNKLALCLEKITHLKHNYAN